MTPASDYSTFRMSLVQAADLQHEVEHLHELIPQEPEEDP
jgi:hypothetical protein